MELYMTYEKYVQLGGTLPQSTFNVLIKKAQIRLDYLTNNRIAKLETIPPEVYELLIAMMDLFNTEKVDRDPSITSYSNGIETFGYSNSKDGITMDNKINNLVSEYLSKYPELFYRGRWQWKQK